jgi:iron complex outermembrane recepter protein
MCFFANLARAQDVPKTPQEGPDTVALTEVVVTANLRSEHLQDVPAAITALSGEMLTKDNISGLDGVSQRTPGLVFAAFAEGQPEIAIRGVGTKEDGPGASDSTVVSVDGVYVAARSAQVFDLFDLERVEVLRGPQGTLYGKNSIGGSINFVTTQPSEQTRIRASVKAGNYGRLDGGALVSGGLTDTLFGKISVNYRSSDGYLRNVLAGSPEFGKREGETESFGYRTGLRWVPTDLLNVSLTLDGAHDDNGATNREPVGSLGPLHNCACASNPVAVNQALGGAGSPYTTLADVQGFTRRDIFGAALTINFDVGFATLTSISAYRQTRYDYLEDSSGLPASSSFTDLTGASGNPNNTLLGPPSDGFTFKVTDAVTEKPKQYTQDLRLTSPTTETFDWLTGLFFSREQNFRTEGFVFPSLGRSDRLPSSSITLQSNKGTAYAAYGQASYHITDRFKVTGGARYSWEKKEITSEARISSGLPLLLQAYPQIAADKAWNNISWRLVADYHATDNALLYASVATGFKSGGFTGSASTAAVAAAPFGPEKATNYEVGAKTELFNRRVRANLATFYTDYRDLQVTRFFQPIGTTFGQFITENAGQALLQGVELELSAHPFRNFEVGASYAYLDAHYTRFTGLPSTIGTGNFDGNRLRQAPRNTASVYASYTYPLSTGDQLSAGVDWSYRSLSYYDPDNNPITVIPSYDLFNGRFGYLSSNGHWDVSLWVKNAGDEKYRTHVFSQRDGRIAFALFGEPRTYGLTLTYNQ